MNRRPIYVYATMPLDWWGGFIDLSRHDIGLFCDNYDCGADPQQKFRLEVAEFVGAAKQLAYSKGWEGDMQAGPFFSVVPDPAYNASRFVVGWKQSNNGTTFIVSEMRLPHLEGC